MRHSRRPEVAGPGQQKGIMRKGSESIRVLIHHWRWLEANGYKQQAASCKLQAASLTRKNYNVIGESRRKKLCKQKTL
jgi:hypothetical protein